MPGYSHPGQHATEGYIAELLRRQQGIAGGVLSVTQAGIEAHHDKFTVAATPATTYTLTYLPLDQAVWVTLNGLTLDEGTDYTCDYSTGIITVNTTNQPLTSGDVLLARYLTTTDSVAASATPDTGVLLLDTFSGAAASIAGRTPDGGGPAWSVYHGTISTDGAGKVGCTATGYTMAHAAVGQNDYRIRTVLGTLDTVGSRSGPAFRWNYTGATNGYAAYVYAPNAAGGRLCIGYPDILGWATTMPNSHVVTDTEPWAAGDTMELLISGAALTVYRNGVQVAADAGALSDMTTGDPGLWIGYVGSATYDRIEVDAS